MTDTNVRRLVDQALDTAQAAHPGIEFSITLSAANALLLPKDSDKLWRPNSEGRMGYFRGHVYRDCLVDDILDPGPAPIDFLVIVSPVHVAGSETDNVPTYYGDLRSGELDTKLPADLGSN